MRRFFLVCLLSMLPAAATHAAEIKVFSSTGVRSVVEELLPSFERASGHKVSIEYDTAALLLRRLESGERADLVLLTRSAADDLIKRGKASATSVKDLARSGAGLAVKAGAPRPDIGSAEGFRRALLDAKSIAYTTTGASGMHFAKVIEQLGIAEQVKAKAKTPAGGFVGELVARGEAELAIQQIPELMSVPGIVVVGPFPPELQSYTMFTAVIPNDATKPDAASALLSFLTAPAAIEAFRAKGMQP